MRGKFAHSQVLLKPIDEAFKAVDLSPGIEYATGKGRSVGFIDMLVETPRGRLAVEAEMTPKRVLNDVIKARDVGASELWIIVPRFRLRQLVLRKLARAKFSNPAPRISVLCVAQALTRVRDYFPETSRPNVERETKKQIPFAARQEA